MGSDSRLERLEEMAGQLIRFGEVVSVNEAAATARVSLPDADGLVSYDLPVLQLKTHEDKCYCLPDVGEQVVCLFLGNGVERGVVLGAVYSKGDAVPVSCRDKLHVRFKDGTWLEYDRQAHVLAGEVKGDVSLKVEKSATVEAGQAVTLKAPLIELQGMQRSIGADGGSASVEEKSDRRHEGSYTLIGRQSVSGPVSVTGPVTIDGPLTVTGGTSNIQKRVIDASSVRPWIQIDATIVTGPALHCVTLTARPKVV